jgi:phage terminase large subunit-like protein
MRTQKIRYPDNYNPILDYWEEIESGREVVGIKLKKSYAYLVSIINQKRTSGYHFSSARSNHAIEFIENYCKHSQGKMGGQAVILELWEKALIAATFGFINAEGNRKHQKVVLIIGKKNGKSLLASAIGAYLLIADGEHGPEVYAVAKQLWSL